MQLTLHGLQAELEARGVKVSHNAIWLFFRREGLRFQKVCSLLSGHALALLGVDSVGADGSAASTRDDWSSSTRPGSKPIWPRCVAGRKGASGYVALPRMATGEHCPSSVACAATNSPPLASSTDRLTAAVSKPIEQQLVPVPRPGDIVVMDNLGSRKSVAIRQLIQAAGTRLRFLPTYSPDLNPIEQAFAKIKHWMGMPRSAPLKAPGVTSAFSRQQSSPANAKTTSKTPDMIPSKLATL